MHGMNDIEPVQSELASLVVFAREKNVLLRLFINYRKLNAVSDKDAFPFMRIDHCLRLIGKVHIFPTPDDSSW